MTTKAETMTDLQACATSLINAAASASSAPPLTGTYPDLDVATAYQIQDLVVADRISRGAVLVGAKLGLTSVAKQQQMNVAEPCYGWLTSDMRIDAGTAVITAAYGQPRCEPEIAFLLGTDLEGANVGAADVLAATAMVLPAVEVIDSRYAGYKFTLPDVVADNSSSAGFVLGAQGISPIGVDLRLVGCNFYKNGQLIATATGAAALGNPASCVAWLVRHLAARGQGLKAGMVVMAGALTEAIAVAPGDTITAEFDRLGSVIVSCQ